MQLRALISVSNKTGIADFARALTAQGYEIISSGGTHRHLSEAGVAVTKVSDVTGFPEILDGRVKTLHPMIHAALLARYDLESHRQQLEDHQVTPIQLLVVNLYPFVETISREGVSTADAVEQIDIGGPAMIRAAAKNFQHLTVLTDPGDYPGFLACDAQALPDFRRVMAQKAFAHTSQYDAHIARYLQAPQADETEPFAPQLDIHATRVQVLRYGENPHQEAAFYAWGDERPAYRLHQGKAMSYNNLVDMDAAWRCVREFAPNTAVVVKHTNPCGVGCGASVVEAFKRARQVDPVSAFGGVIAVNQPLDEDTARAITENFAELVIAPAFTQAALARFKKRKNLRVIEMVDDGVRTPALELRRLDSGLLVQNLDQKRVPQADWTLVSQKQPTDAQLKALEMAWNIVIHVKSNAIVYADEWGALGIGAGQMSRVDSARIAVHKASEAGFKLSGSAMASDAFFPFRDSIDAAAKAGVSAVVEPGGSIRDEEVIQAANEHGMVLFFTATRHFKH